MLAFFLYGLVGAALVECSMRFMSRSSTGPRRSLFESSIFVISIAGGSALAYQVKQHFDSEWKRAAMYVLTVTVTVAVGQLIIYFYKAQQNAQTDRA